MLHLQMLACTPRIKAPGAGCFPPGYAGKNRVFPASSATLSRHRPLTAGRHVPCSPTVAGARSSHLLSSHSLLDMFPSLVCKANLWRTPALTNFPRNRSDAVGFPLQARQACRCHSEPMSPLSPPCQRPWGVQVVLLPLQDNIKAV